jgi:glycerophosphoryl diester phosphodiesterase
MVIMGHRGGSKPDNSVESFKKAVDDKLQVIELDVSAKY